MTPRALRRLFNLWPPFLFTGIRVLDLGDDWRHARVRLRLRWYNRNYVRAHFGGSFEIGVPVLGICYGMQTMASQLGGKVESSGKREFGYAEIRARGHSELFRNIQDRSNDEGHGLLDVWMSHGDKVTELPAGFKVIASSDSCPIAAMADEARRFYAVQFHPEVTHTIKGKEMFARFVHEICGCGHDWNMPDYVNEAIEKVRAQVGKEEVILGLSGGVDSSVVAALLHRAIGDQLTCVFASSTRTRPAPSVSRWRASRWSPRWCPRSSSRSGACRRCRTRRLRPPTCPSRSRRSSPRATRSSSRGTGAWCSATTPGRA